MALADTFDQVVDSLPDDWTDLERRVPGLNPKLVAADLVALRPAFTGLSGRPGELDGRVLRAWSAWEVKFGLVSRRPDVDQAFAISR